jgi:hypothetical protein
MGPFVLTLFGGSDILTLLIILGTKCSNLQSVAASPASTAANPASTQTSSGSNNNINGGNTVNVDVGKGAASSLSNPGKIAVGVTIPLVVAAVAVFCW